MQYRSLPPASVLAVAVRDVMGGRPASPTEPSHFTRNHSVYYKNQGRAPSGKDRKPHDTSRGRFRSCGNETLSCP